MTRWVIVSAAPQAGDVAGLVEELRDLPGVTSCSAGPDIEGSVGGRGMTWDVVADAAPATPGLKQLDVDIVPLLPVRSHRAESTGPRVKRTLLLTVKSGTPDDVVARFEADLLAMPRHISTIRSWELSRVDTALAGGGCAWTHVWEQEYDDVDGLNGEYLLSPYHWSFVDRWFDVELRDSIVEPVLAHLYRWADGPVIG